MKVGSLLLLVLALILTNVCDARRVRRSTSVNTLRNFNHITKQLRDFTTSLGKYDEELRRAISAAGADGRLHERSSDNDEFLSELRRRRRVVQSMKNVFDDVQLALERQTKRDPFIVNVERKSNAEWADERAEAYEETREGDSPGK